ncbi:MAG: hypothetical protein ABMB14_18250, partial [Myxococcota bacterium]
MIAWLVGTVAGAQTADFDTFAEGTNGPSILDGGISFQNMDNRGLSAPPGNIAIDQVDADLAGQPGFTAPNALGFGGYSPGPNAGYGRFGSIELTNGGLGGSAEVSVFEPGGHAGLTVTLEALSAGVVVGSDTQALSAGFGVAAHTLAVNGVTFDLLRLSIGPNANDVAFVVIDHAVIGPVGETGDTGAAPTDTATSTDGTVDGDADTDADADSDTDADSDADSDADA